MDVRVAGPLAAKQQTEFNYEIEVPAFKRHNVWVPIDTHGNGKLTFSVGARDALDGDAVEHSLPVNLRRSLETAAAYGTTTAKLEQVSVQVPEGIHTAEFSVFSILGKEVLTTEIFSNSNAIDISSLTKGIYIATITSNGNRISYKLIKN